MWIVYALSAAVVWGLDYALSEQILKGKVSPISLLTMQMVVGGLCMLPFVYRTHLKTEVPALLADHRALWLVLAAIVSFNLGNLLIFLSIEAKNATIAGLIELCYPIFTVAFTWLLFKENHVNWGVGLGGLFIFAGIGIIYYFGG